MFERVQRVVMDEDADRPLRRQEMRQLVDHFPEGRRRAGPSPVARAARSRRIDTIHARVDRVNR
jgi:hypothetical protein